MTGTSKNLAKFSKVCGQLPATSDSRPSQVCDHAIECREGERVGKGVHEIFSSVLRQSHGWREANGGSNASRRGLVPIGQPDMYTSGGCKGRSLSSLKHS